MYIWAKLTGLSGLLEKKKGEEWKPGRLPADLLSAPDPSSKAPTLIPSSVAEHPYQVALNHLTPALGHLWSLASKDTCSYHIILNK